MKTILFAAAALSLAAVVPASAQMAGPGMGTGPGMGGGMGPMGAPTGSCVSGGQFVPCPMGGMMQPGAGMGAGPGMGPRGMMPDEGMEPPRRMTRAQKRRMMREQQGM